MVTCQKGDGTYKIDFSKFDNVYPVDTPTLSAKEVSVLAVRAQYIFDIGFMYRGENTENGGWSVGLGEES